MRLKCYLGFHKWKIKIKECGCKSNYLDKCILCGTERDFTKYDYSGGMMKEPCRHIDRDPPEEE